MTHARNRTHGKKVRHAAHLVVAWRLYAQRISCRVSACADRGRGCGCMGKGSCGCVVVVRLRAVIGQHLRTPNCRYPYLSALKGQFLEEGNHGNEDPAEG